MNPLHALRTLALQQSHLPLRCMTLSWESLFRRIVGFATERPRLSARRSQCPLQDGIELSRWLWAIVSFWKSTTSSQSGSATAIWQTPRRAHLAASQASLPTCERWDEWKCHVHFMSCCSIHSMLQHIAEDLLLCHTLHARAQPSIGTLAALPAWLSSGTKGTLSIAPPWRSGSLRW